MLVHRLSVKAPRPATPSAKIAPITRAVSSVSVHGQMAIAALGTRNRNPLVASAAMPSTPMSRAVRCGSRRSSAVARRLLPPIQEPHREYQERSGEIQGRPQPERDIGVNELVPMQ